MQSDLGTWRVPGKCTLCQDINKPNYIIMKLQLERLEITESGRKDAIVNICNHYFHPHNVLDDMNKRTRPLVERRMMTMLLLRNFARRLSLADIGQVFKKDHATALHAVKTMRNLIETDVRLQTQYISLRNQIISEIGKEGEVEDTFSKIKRLNRVLINRDITRRGILIEISRELEYFPEHYKRKVYNKIEECLNLL
jgi:AraC-like DNA-binding protein